MAYLFGSANTDCIDCGTAVTTAATFSAFIRFKVATADSTLRLPFGLRNAGGTRINLQIYFNSGTNVLNGAVTVGAGTADGTAPWTSGFTAGTIHTVVVTVSGTAMALYADTDATPKVSATLVNVVDTDGTQDFSIGNLPGQTFSLNGTMYEVGWWAGTAVSAAEAAAMGSGTPPATQATHYWPLVSDANALFGGHNGTVTGATVVAHSGANLYAAAGGPSPLLTVLRPSQDFRGA